MDSLVQIKVEYEKLGQKNVKIIHINGRMTLANSMELANKLKKYFDDDNYNILMDFTNLQYLDSKGMAMLLTIERSVKDNHGILVLTRPNSFIQGIFQLTNLESYFTFVKDLDEGREYFSKLKT